MIIYQSGLSEWKCYKLCLYRKGFIKKCHGIVVIVFHMQVWIKYTVNAVVEEVFKSFASVKKVARPHSKI